MREPPCRISCAGTRWCQCCSERRRSVDSPSPPADKTSVRPTVPPVGAVQCQVCSSRQNFLDSDRRAFCKKTRLRDIPCGPSGYPPALPASASGRQTELTPAQESEWAPHNLKLATCRQ